MIADAIKPMRTNQIAIRLMFDFMGRGKLICSRTVTEKRNLVPRGGVEPPRPFEQGILSPVCLPFHHLGKNKNGGE